MSKITELIATGPGFRPRAFWPLPTTKKKGGGNVGSPLKGRDLKHTEK